jgi:hypothetical protein
VDSTFYWSVLLVLFHWQRLSFPRSLLITVFSYIDWKQCVESASFREGWVFWSSNQSFLWEQLESSNSVRWCGDMQISSENLFWNQTSSGWIPVRLNNPLKALISSVFVWTTTDFRMISSSWHHNNGNNSTTRWKYAQ